jgi:hypothetical protein
MAEMRLRARPSVLLAGLLLLLALPALAAADPQPIAKPSIQPIKPAKSPAKSPTHSSTPPVKSPPPVKSTPPANTAPPPASSTFRSSTRSTGAIKAPVHTAVVVVTAEGGRDQSGIAVPAPPPPEPTPLGLVATGDRATSPGTSTPAWKIALLALLAAAEAFLVVRLVRNRPGDLSPAQ